MNSREVAELLELQVKPVLSSGTFVSAGCSLEMLPGIYYSHFYPVKLNLISQILGTDMGCKVHPLYADQLFFLRLNFHPFFLDCSKDHQFQKKDMQVKIDILVYSTEMLVEIFFDHK